MTAPRATLYTGLFWLLVIGGGVAWAVQTVYALHRSAEQQIETVEPRYARLLGLAADKDRLKEAAAVAARAVERHAYPATRDASQAGNDAQQRVRDVFSKAGLDVVSIQVLPARAHKQFDRIPISLRADGETGGTAGHVGRAAHADAQPLRRGLQFHRGQHVRHRARARGGRDAALRAEGAPMRRLVLPLLALATLALLGLLAWLWITPQGQWVGVTWQPPAPIKPSLDGPSGLPQTGVELGRYVATLERPLFVASRRPPPPPPAASAPIVVDTPPDLRVLGLYGRKGDGATIGGMIARVDGQVKRLRIGDSVGRWTLKALRPGEAVLALGETEQVYPLRRAAADEPPAAGDNATTSGACTCCAAACGQCTDAA